MQDFLALVVYGTQTSFCIMWSFVISHALSALFDVCVLERSLIELGEAQSN